MSWENNLEAASRALIDNDSATAKAEAAKALSNALLLGGTEGSAAVAAVRRFIDLLESNNNNGSGGTTSVPPHTETNNSDIPTATPRVPSMVASFWSYGIAFVVFLPIGIWGWWQQQAIGLYVGMIGCGACVVIGMVGDFLISWLQERNCSKND